MANGSHSKSELILLLLARPKRVASIFLVIFSAVLISGVLTTGCSTTDGETGEEKANQAPDSTDGWEEAQSGGSLGSSPAGNAHASIMQRLCNSLQSENYTENDNSCDPIDKEALDYKKLKKLLQHPGLQECRKFFDYKKCDLFDSRGALDVYGKYVYDAVSNVEKARDGEQGKPPTNKLLWDNNFSEGSRLSRILRYCPHYKSFNQEDRKMFWVWFFMGLSFGESRCKSDVVAQGVNQLAIGLYQMEKDPPGFRPGWCKWVKDKNGRFVADMLNAKDNIYCAVAVYNDFFDGRIVADDITYFERAKGCGKRSCGENQGDSCNNFDPEMKVTGDIEFTLCTWTKSFPPCYQGWRPDSGRGTGQKKGMDVPNSG